MIEITMTSEEFLRWLEGDDGGWYLTGNEPGFDPWEQATERTKVLVNGDVAEVFIEAFPPACSCCQGDRGSYDWSVTLTT